MTLPDSQARLLLILETLDLAAFREVTGAGIDRVTDDEVLEALHRTRLGHTDIHWKLRANSKRWLSLNTVEGV